MNEEIYKLGLPKPVADYIDRLFQRIEDLEKRLKKIEGENEDIYDDGWG